MQRARELSVYNRPTRRHHAPMPTHPSIGILGSGSWGTAVAHVIRSNGHPTLLWGRDREVLDAVARQRVNPRYLPEHTLAEGIETTTELHEVATRCQLIFVVVPTKVLRAVVSELSAFLHPDHLLVSCSKGLESGSAKRMTEVLREETCCLRVGAMSGPNLAAEVMRGDPAATVVASRYEEVVARATRVLMGRRFRVYGNHDVLGVELAGAMKNIVAIAAGASAGLGFGDNTLSLLVTRGLAEMRRIGVRLGADPMTFAGLAGVGDLMVTCASPLSRNHQVGVRLARGQSMDQIRAEMRQVAEGVSTTAVVHELTRKLELPAHITRAVYGLAHEGRHPEAVLGEVMAVEAMYEVDQPIAAR